MIKFEIYAIFADQLSRPVLMTHIEFSDFSAGYKAKISMFGTMECHIMLEPSDKEAGAADCIASLDTGLKAILADGRIKGFRQVFRRWFLSDAAAQTCLLPQCEVPTSVIQQPPLDGSKAVLWVWLMKDVSDRYEYLFRGSMLSDGDGSYGQMQEILTDYSKELEHKRLNITDDCARTWIYVRDVDVNYAGIVKARRELFDVWGMTSATHYLASTGINGLTENHRNLVSMDAYAVRGLGQENVRYLHALDNLSPTHVYGVTFERGTALHFEDRTQILISGTASIDNKGEIVSPGDVDRQTERTFENIGALLKEGGASFDDIAQMIVYLRDTADYKKVSRIISERFPDTPCVITWAPVCRPGWLVEVECIAYV